jgi:hypothetical protein
LEDLEPSQLAHVSAGTVDVQFMHLQCTAATVHVSILFGVCLWQHNVVKVLDIFRPYLFFFLDGSYPPLSPIIEELHRFGLAK